MRYPMLKEKIYTDKSEFPKLYRAYPSKKKLGEAIEKEEKQNKSKQDNKE